MYMSTKHIFFIIYKEVSYNRKKKEWRATPFIIKKE